MSRDLHQLLRDRLLARAGVRDVSVPTLKQLRESEWSPLFERRMRDRLIQGAYRYATLQERREGKKRYGNVSAALGHLRRYLDDGNQEHLVDAANYCLLEHEAPCCHSKPSFRSVDDGDHARRL
jgi:hypothetical protein